MTIIRYIRSALRAFGAAVLTQSTTARADDWADTLNYRPFQASAPAAAPRRAKTVRQERAQRPARTEQAARAPLAAGGPEAGAGEERLPPLPVGELP